MTNAPMETVSGIPRDNVGSPADRPPSMWRRPPQGVSHMHRNSEMGISSPECGQSRWKRSCEHRRKCVLLGPRVMQMGSVPLSLGRAPGAGTPLPSKNRAAVTVKFFPFLLKAKILLLLFQSPKPRNQNKSTSH